MHEKNIYIENKLGEKLYVNVLEFHNDAPNIVYIQTPIGSVIDLKNCYTPLVKHGFNVFAIDLSGIGQSEGKVSAFSIETLKNDLDACVAYIKENYNDVVHMFGGTGTGGVLGQHYITGENEIKSFVQYGLANYKDVSALGNSTMIKLLYPILPLFQKLAPNMKIKFKPNDFNGKHADKENEWYEQLMRANPKVMDMSISILKTLLDILLSKTSNIKNRPNCPVLVFAPMHDRYFTMNYIQKYYNWLDKPKKMYEIDDSHLSFVWHAEDVCREACRWFKLNTD